MRLQNKLATCSKTYIVTTLPKKIILWSMGYDYTDGSGSCMPPLAYTENRANFTNMKLLKHAVAIGAMGCDSQFQHRLAST